MGEYVGDISVLIAVDWFLGMARTAVNIFGEAILSCFCETKESGQDLRKDVVLRVGFSP